jgi:hypothetical protein
MDNFYVIKLINKHNGSRGFVMQRGTQILISSELTGEVTMFQSVKEANIFIKENKLQRNGITTMVLSNQELIDSGVGTKAEKTDNIYTAMNLNGDYIFYNTVLSTYYFDKMDVGFCVWNDRIKLDEFIQNQMFGFEVVIKQIK